MSTTASLPETPTVHVNSVTHADEWHRMWAALVAHWRGDFAEYNPECGECWQYMGTTHRDGQWLHCFRHRMHPRTQKREYHIVPASPSFSFALNLHPEADHGL